MIVGTAELDVVARAANFESSLRSETAGGFGAIGKEAETAGAEVERSAKSGKLAGGFGAVGGLFGGLNTRSEKASGGIKKQLEGLTAPFGGLGMVATAGVGVAIGGMIDLASKFQPVESAIAGAEGISVAAADKIGQAFLKTSGDSVFSGTQMAGAFAPVSGVLEQLNGKALTASQSVKFMAESGDLAEAAHIDLNTATHALVQTMQAYHVSSGGAATATSALFQASRITGQGVDQIANSMARLHTQLGAAAPPLAGATALLVDMTQHGETGRAAMSALGSAFNGIIAPSAAVVKAQKDMGLSFINAKTGALDPIAQIIGELSPKIAGMGSAQATATLKTLGFGGASDKLVAVMQAGLPAFNKAYDSVTKVGAAHAAAQLQSHNFERQMQTAKAAVSNLATGLGTDLMPIFSKIATVLARDLVPILSKLGSFIQKNSSWILPLVGALLAAFAAFKIGTLVVAAFNAVMDANPWVLAITALALVVVLFATHWKEIWGGIKDVAEDAWHFLDDDIIQPLEAAWHAVWGALSDAWNTVEPIIKTWGPVVLAAVAPIIGIPLLVIQHWQVIVDFFTALPGRIVGFFKDAGKWLLEAGRKILDGLWTGFQYLTPEGLIIKFHTQIIGFLSKAATWLVDAGKDILSGLWHGIVTAWDALGDIGRTVEHWLVTGLKDAGTWLVDVGKDIIHGLVKGIEAAAGDIVKGIKKILSHIPGAGLLSHAPIIGGLFGAQGGVMGQTLGLQVGGTIGDGMITQGPVAVVGEGNSGWPEYVIPTDPTYRGNARKLYSALGAELYAVGGIVGSPAGAGAASAANSGPAAGDTFLIGPVVAPDPMTTADEVVRRLRARQWLNRR